MTLTPNANGECSKRVKGAKRGREEGGKYTRYTEEQLEALEKVYGECSNPNCSQRAKILREQPNLKDLDNKQLKVWFQNRRCREKQKKENGELLEENKKLTLANKVLREENDYLHNKVAELLYDNEYLRNQFLSLTSANITATATATASAAETTDLGQDKSPQTSIKIANNEGLLLLADETRNEFLSKSSGTGINWKTILTLKLPSRSSVGVIYVSETCIGVAARACTIIPFEPIKIIEILKDRTLWSRNCRNLDVLAQYPMENGGSIELICTQYYAPTTMACARDFWTLRYTSVLDDGSLLVCEKSISGADAVPSSPAALEFVRGRMLASGYMIRPCEGGSTINLVEHLDLEASSVPEVIRPLYESSELVAKKMIFSAIRYIENMANEKNDKGKHAYCEGPAFLRSFSQRLSRGFNDAINGFTEDGWMLENANASDDVIVSVKRIRKFGDIANYDSIICVKASFLLKNVIPAKLVTLLKERRSSWMDFDFDDNSTAFSRAACFPFPRKKTHNLSETAVLLGRTNYEDEVLEVIRFKRVAHSVSSGDVYHLQISNGMEEDTGFGACSELIFAPIDRTIPNDAVLLCSGFRIILLGSNTSDMQGTWSSANSASNASNVHAPSSMVNLAFQFPFQTHLQEDVALMAQKYIQRVISSVKNISLEIMLSGSQSNPAINSNEPNPAMGPVISPDSISAAMNSTEESPAMELEFSLDSIYDAINFIEESPQVVPEIFQDSIFDAINSIEESPAVGPAIAPVSTYAATNTAEANPAMGPTITPDSTYDVNLANLLCESYRSNLGLEMLGFNSQSNNSLLELIKHHQYAILCFSFSSVPVCLYANQAGLNMLETTTDNLLSFTVDKILGGSDNVSLFSLLPTIMKQGYIILPPGYFISGMNHFVSYEQAVVWSVKGPDGSVLCLAFAFDNWSFV